MRVSEYERLVLLEALRFTRSVLMLLKVALKELIFLALVGLVRQFAVAVEKLLVSFVFAPELRQWVINLRAWLLTADCQVHHQHLVCTLLLLGSLRQANSYLALLVRQCLA